MILHQKGEKEWKWAKFILGDRFNMYSINFEGGLGVRCNNNSDNKDNFTSSYSFHCAMTSAGEKVTRITFLWDKLSYYFYRKFYSRLL